MTTQTTKNKITTCKNGCNKPAKRIGLCSTCYNKHLKQIKEQNGIKCIIEGCDSIEFSKGYCTKHYKQLYKHNEIKRTIYDLNEYIEHENFIEIILYDSKCNEVARTIIDKEDIIKAKQYKWYLHSEGYAVYKSDKEIIYLHRLLMNPDEYMVIDHIDGNKLNNRKENLRICTQQNNLMNKSKQLNNTSGIVGVHWHKKFKKWETYISLNGEKKILGYYEDIIEAKDIRLKAEIKYFGEYSKNYQLNKEINNK